MDKKIQDIVNACENGKHPTMDRMELGCVFEKNHNPTKETVSEAMEKWIDRAESLLGIENDLILDDAERPPYYIFRAKAGSSKNQIVTDEYHKQEPKEDLVRIQKALFLHRGISCSLDECGNIWQNYSWVLSASWLDIPNDLERIIKQIESADKFKSYADWLE